MLAPLAPDAANVIAGWMKTAVRILVSFIIGCIIGVVGHYTLYRMGLPVEPFIYMAF